MKGSWAGLLLAVRVAEALTCPPGNPYFIATRKKGCQNAGSMWTPGSVNEAMSGCEADTSCSGITLKPAIEPIFAAKDDCLTSAAYKQQHGDGATNSRCNEKTSQAEAEADCTRAGKKDGGDKVEGGYCTYVLAGATLDPGQEAAFTVCYGAPGAEDSEVTCYYERTNSILFSKSLTDNLGRVSNETGVALMKFTEAQGSVDQRFKDIEDVKSNLSSILKEDEAAWDGAEGLRGVEDDFKEKTEALETQQKRFDHFIVGLRRPMYLDEMHEAYNWLFERINATQIQVETLLNIDERESRTRDKGVKTKVGYAFKEGSKVAEMANDLFNNIMTASSEVRLRAGRLQKFLNLDAEDPTLPSGVLPPLLQVIQTFREDLAAARVAVDDPLSGWPEAVRQEKAKRKKLEKKITAFGQVFQVLANETWMYLNRKMDSSGNALYDRLVDADFLRGNISDAKEDFKFSKRRFIRQLKGYSKIGVSRAATLQSEVRSKGEEISDRAAQGIHKHLGGAIVDAKGSLRDGLQLNLASSASFKAAGVADNDRALAKLRETGAAVATAQAEMNRAKGGVGNLTRDIKHFLRGLTRVKVEMQKTIAQQDKDAEVSIKLKGPAFAKEAADRGLDLGAEAVQDVADNVVKELKNYSAQEADTLAADSSPLVGDADANARSVRGNMSVAANFLRGKMEETQKLAEGAAATVNHMLPRVQEFYTDQGRGVLNGLLKLEQYLKSKLGEPIIWAAEAEHNEGSAAQVAAAERLEDVQERFHGRAGAAADKVRQLQGTIGAAARALEKKLANLDGKVDYVNGKVDRIGYLMQNDTAEVRDAVLALEALHTDRSEKSEPVLEHLLETSRAEIEDWLKTHHEDATDSVKSRTSNVKKQGEAAKAKTVAGGQLAMEQIESTADDSLELYGGKAKEAHEALRVLGVRLRKGVANATEWSEALEQKISGAAGAAERTAILESDNRAAQQTAVHERYNKLIAAAQRDAHGIEAKAQSDMTALAEEAKQEALRITASSALSAEEKAKALEKVDAWLAKQLHDVSDKQSEAASAAGAAENALGEFEIDATQRAAELRALLDKENPALALEHDARGVASAQLTIDDVLEDVERQAERLKAATSWELQVHRDSRAGANPGADDGSTNATSDVKALAVQTTLANELAQGLVTKVQTAFSSYGDAERASEAAQAAFDQSTTGTSELVKQRLKELLEDVVAREDRQRAWTLKYQSMAAGTTRKLAGLIVTMLQNSDAKLQQQKKALAKHAQRAEALLESDDIKSLRKVAKADKDLDGILSSQAAAQRWRQTYDTLTAQWRQEVAQSYDAIEGGVKLEVKAMGAQDGELRSGLNASAGDAMQQEGHAVLDVAQREFGAIKTAQAATDAELAQVGKEQASRAQRGAEEEENLRANLENSESAAALKAAGIHGAAATITSGLAAGEEESQTARTQLDEAISLRGKQVEEQKAEVNSRFQTLRNSDFHTSSILEVGSNALRVHAWLHAEHERLAQRARALAAELRLH